MKKGILCIVLIVCMLALTLPAMALGADETAGTGIRRSAAERIYQPLSATEALYFLEPPAGYTSDGKNTMAYSSESGRGIDVKGKYLGKDGAEWLRTTYGDRGYSFGTEGLGDGSVTSAAEFINDGRYIKLSYTVTSGAAAISGGKLAVHADTMIGYNDSAKIETIRNSRGQAIGLLMVDDNEAKASYGAQFNLYFAGAGGVTPASTYWIGSYYDREENQFNLIAEETKSTGGAYDWASDGTPNSFSGEDSGLAISWQNIELAAGESRTFSLILGIGEKSDPPEWTGAGGEKPLTLTPGQDGGSMSVEALARLSDAAGVTDTLYYSVDNGPEAPLGSGEAQGENPITLEGTIDLSGHADGEHQLRFWIVNSKGASSEAIAKTVVIEGGKIMEIEDYIEEVPGPAEQWREYREIRVGTSAIGYERVCDSGEKQYARLLVPTDLACDGGAKEAVIEKSLDAAASVSAVSYYKDGEPFAGLPTEAGTYTAAFTLRHSGVIPESGYSASLTYTIFQQREESIVSGEISGTGIYSSVTAELLALKGSIYPAEISGAGSPYSYRVAAPRGQYNLVVTARTAEGKTILVTSLVDLSKDVSNHDILLPEGEKNSVVEYAEGAPVLVVGGLDAIADAGEAGVVTEVKLIVSPETETTAAGAEAIKGLSSGKNLEFLDLTLKKTLDGVPVPDFGSDNTALLNIIIPFDSAGKKNITVYRYHGGEADALTETANASGEYIEVSLSSVTIYAKRFSTYAIGYAVEAEDKDTSGRGDSGSASAASAPANTPCGRGADCPIRRFADASAEAWYHDGVHYCLERGLMGGVTATAFEPDAPATRGMLVSVLYRLENSPKTEGENPFLDVKEGAWYADAVKWAAAGKIAAGYGDNRFGPEDFITREQLAAVFMNYARAKGLDVSGRGEVSRFSDSGETSAYARDAVSWAVSAGLLKGMGEGRLDPKGGATRAEAADVLERFCETIAR